MKHLNSLKIVNDSWLDLAINSQKETANQLNALTAAIRASYINYETTIVDRASRLNDSTFGSHKDLIADYYSRPPKNLRDRIRERRNDHCLNECPYCGYPFQPDTLDHFVPKDLWPEFSIYPNNLVPQCKHCAPIKSSKYFCPSERMVIFVHPIYFDLLARVGFLVDASYVNGMASFDCKFSIMGNLACDDRAALRSHIKELDLKCRFNRYCCNEYAHWKRKICAKNFDIRQALQQRINETPFTASFSPNWKIAFLKGVLSCDPLIEHLGSFAPAT